MKNKRDNFSSKTVDILKKRASFICSNPDCRKLTIAPSSDDETKILYFGRASHITAAAIGGPRFDNNLNPDERISIDNAIFLCSNCADMIDDNNGIDFSVDLIKSWKKQHDLWINSNLNKRIDQENNQINNNFNITSINQTGGITAGVVNLEKPGRHLDLKLIKQLDKIFNNSMIKVRLSAIMSDREALRFAEEIKNYLNSKGFNITFIEQYMESPPFFGQSISDQSDGTKHIKIGIIK